MNIQEVVPFERLGDLRLGMSRTAVRSMLGSNFKSFRKGPDSINETDAYDQLGMHLYYDADDQLEFIEMFPPSDPAYQGVHLLNNSLDQVLQKLAAIGQHYHYDDDGYDFKQLGVVLYVPDDSIESVAVYRRGYYGD